MACCLCALAAGGRFHPGFLLCDPYAVRAAPVLLPESAYANAARMPPKLDLSRPVVLASLCGFVQVRTIIATFEVQSMCRLGLTDIMQACELLAAL